MAPAHETHSTWQRFTTWFRKQSRGRKVLLVVWAGVVLVLMVRAETLGTRFMVLGFSCLLLPVAWTLVPGKRR